MAKLLIFIITFVAAVSMAEQHNFSKPTDVNRWPSIVQVESRNMHNYWTDFCTASILRSRFILSAAQCFYGVLYQTENRRIRAGATYRQHGGIMHYIEVAYNHPSYMPYGMDGDIAVVKLRNPLIFSHIIQQGQIINQGIAVPDNLPVRAVGWIYDVYATLLLPRLKETEVYTVNNRECAARYLTAVRRMTITENMICTGVIDNESYHCQGDPGAPLYFVDPYQGDVIVGLYSFTLGCANNTFPGVNTAVSPYTNWIVATAV